MNRIKQCLYLCVFLLLLSCKLSIDNTINGSAIVAGKSSITGRIEIPVGISKESISVKINVPHGISGENVTYETKADTSGIFSLTFDVELDTSIVMLVASIDQFTPFMVKVVNGRVTNVDITYDSYSRLKNIEIVPAMNKYDVTQSEEVLRKMVEYRRPNGEYPSFYDKGVNFFLNSLNNSFSQRVKIVLDKETLLSKEFKGLYAKELRLFVYTPTSFDYQGEIERNYRNVTRDTIGKPEIQQIDKTYFRFLKEFNLSDTQYLQTYGFPEFQTEVLRNEILGIPEIGESDISSWMKSVKAILADLVGFKDGLYYDVLAANAFSQQLHEEAKPLSDKQKANIAQYWGDGEIAKILFRKNEKIIEYDAVKSPLVVNDVSLVPKENVIEAIVSKYKGKVVFMDLWATWCGPCLEAMKEFNKVKGEFVNEDVVFVYVTNGSSPKKLWEKKIQGIGSEHYYLSGDQWTFMMDHFGFEYIPSYVLYNKEGKLVDKISSFPGNEKVKKLLKELLK